jgi:predicted MPP superfamily phosphohydrolase
MMRLRYISDIHLEFIKPQYIQQFLEKITPGPSEIAVLAGDVGNLRHSNYDTFMQYMSANFKKTFVIPGNHEYYCLDHKKYSIEQTEADLNEYFIKYDNISYLNNSVEKYEGKTFIGTKLWTKVIDEENDINYTHYIPFMDRDRYNQLNLQCVNFLEGAVANPDNQDCVLITHHLPSYSLIDAKYKTTPYEINQYYCDMDDVIKTYNEKVKLWFYGYTHTPNKTNMGDTILACNPIGYPGENEVPDFNATIEI